MISCMDCEADIKCMGHDPSHANLKRVVNIPHVRNMYMQGHSPSNKA